MQPTNLIPLIMQFLTPAVIDKIADTLGLDRTLARTIISVAVPALLGALTGTAAQPGGAQKLADAARATGSLDNLTSSLGAGDVTALANKGSQLVSSLLGGQENVIISTMSNFAGVGETTGKSLLGIAAPIVVGSIGKALGTSGLNAADVAELAAAQSKHVAAALPPSLRAQLQNVLGGTPLSNVFREVPPNLITRVMQLLTPEATTKIGEAQALSATATNNLISASVPALFGVLGGVASQSGGLQKLEELVKQADPMESLTNMLGGTNKPTGLIDKGSQALASLLGGQENALASAVSKFAGTGQAASTSMLAMLTPLVMGTIKKATAESGAGAAGVTQLLAAQTDDIASALPSGLRDQLMSDLGGTHLFDALRDMVPNLVSRVMQLVTPEATAKIGEAQGLTATSTANLVKAGVPTLLGVLGGVSSLPGGAQKLDALTNQSDPIESLTNMLAGTGKPAGLIDKGSQALTSLLGGQEKALASAVSKFTGTGQAAGASVLAMLTPLVMGTIKKATAETGAGAAGVTQLLAAQKDNIAAALPSGLRDQLKSELSGTPLFDALRDAAGQATGAVGEGTRAAAAATTAALRTGAQATGAAAAGTARAAEATATAAATAASRPLKWLGWAIPIIVIAGLLWYLFGRPGEQATQTTASTPPSAPTSTPSATPPNTPAPSSTASTAPTSPPGSMSANTQARSSVSSALPSIPSLTIGGLDVGKQVSDSFGSLRTSLQGITDKASASAALPNLQQVTTQLDKIGGTLGQATADQRKTIAGWFASLLPGLNQLFDKVLGMPDAASVLKPTIDGLRGKLASLNKELTGTPAQSASAAQSATPAQGAAPTQSASGYSFSAVKDGNAETLTLSGSLPDQATHQAMLAAAKRMFPTDRIVDNTQVKPGAPPEFGKTVNSVLKELSRLGSGNAKITGTDAEISGSAFSDQAASAIKTALASLPGLHVKTDVATATAASVDPADCQKLFKNLLDRAQIQFETGSSNIDTDSTGLLDHLVGVARRCSSATFQVAGYTDSEGNADMNMALSKRRAETVAKYLVSEGITADRVTAAGFGASDPIASNDTEEGRAKNRRIEITTKEQTTTTKR